jgi:hypothetical protein
LIFQDECTKYLKTNRTMDKNNLTDYYPVFKDVSDIMRKMASDEKFEYPLSAKESATGKIGESEYSRSQAILSGEELTDIAFKYGVSVFQALLLSIKNSFEGHVLLKFNIRPEQLFNQGTILFKAKPEILILDFYENFAQFEPGLRQIWSILSERESDLAGISFELIVHSLIVNNLIRFPVLLFTSSDIRSFTDQMLMNQQALHQRFDLVLLGERIVGEYEYIEGINFVYNEKFKEYVNQLRLKEDAYSHYQRKLALAFFTEINNEEELDELMYKKLVEERLSRTPQNILDGNADEHIASVSLIGKLRIREKTKVLYRAVSKSCSEVHSAPDSENSFPELTQIFLEANSIYIKPLVSIEEALLQNIKMMLLFSKVVIFRKIHGFTVAGDLKLLSSACWKEVVSKNDLRSLKRNLEARLIEYRIKCLTDFKLKFIMDDDLTETHSHFLLKQMDFIDQQILQIQNDIREVLKMKSKVSILKTSNN